MKNKIYIFIKGILAGFCIGLGGRLFLEGLNLGVGKVVSAFLFPIGLILICNFDFYLYTGKICYLPNAIKEKNALNYIFELLLGFIGNFFGAFLIAIIFKLCFGNSEIVSGVVQTKLNYEWYKLIVLGFLCGILIYFAVEGFKNIQNNFGKYIVLILCIAGFIIASFEHCIADIFYFSLNGLTIKEILVIIPLITLGNSLGGMLVPTIKLIFEKDKD